MKLKMTEAQKAQKRREYYRKNKEKWQTPEFKARNKAWRTARKPELKQYNDEWIAKHPNYKSRYYGENTKRHKLNCQSRYSKHKELGLCVVCTKPSLENSCLCEFHYIKSVARNNLDIYSGDICRILIDKLDSQGRICPYTGRNIILGKNSSLDHIKPVSLFPDLKNDIDNLEWVDKNVNFAKHTMSGDEFRAFCDEVSLKSLRVSQETMLE